jgi:L-iditol 2-dehydrogenase
MKALVKYAQGPGNLEIRDVEEPSAGKGQVKIQIIEAGICGSDIHIYHSDIAIPVRPPVTIGHEFAGVVAEVGEGVTAFKIGDRVVSETAYHYCGKCDFCREGWYNLCVERRTLGYWFNGIFTKYTVVPEGRVHLIPEGVSFTAAAMTEPLACVVHAVEDLCKIVPEDVVLVSGPGSIGLMAAQLAKAHGAKVVISGTNMDAERLALATKLGADYAVNIQQEDLSKLLMDITGGYGPDAVLECSGAAPAINAALRLIKKRGYFTQIGLTGKKIEFDIEAINYKEMHFSGSIGSRNASWRMALKLQGSGKLQLEPLVSHKFPITQWEEAFSLFESKNCGKVFLLPVD